MECNGVRQVGYRLENGGQYVTNLIISSESLTGAKIDIEVRHDKNESSIDHGSIRYSHNALFCTTL